MTPQEAITQAIERACNGGTKILSWSGLGLFSTEVWIGEDRDFKVYIAKNGKWSKVVKPYTQKVGPKETKRIQVAIANATEAR